MTRRGAVHDSAARSRRPRPRPTGGRPDPEGRAALPGARGDGRRGPAPGRRRAGRVRGGRHPPLGQGGDPLPRRGPRARRRRGGVTLNLIDAFSYYPVLTFVTGTILEPVA